VSLSREEVIRYLEGLSSMELAALIVELQERVGLPQPLRVEERRYNVVSGPEVRDDSYRSIRLCDAGKSKLEVIKVVRALKTLGLHEAKELVERAPVTLFEYVPLEEAAAVARRLEEAGAKVEVR
jgi:large subunit ribosomal protein L7/L12